MQCCCSEAGEQCCCKDESCEKCLQHYILRCSSLFFWDGCSDYEHFVGVSGLRTVGVEEVGSLFCFEASFGGERGGNFDWEHVCGISGFGIGLTVVFVACCRRAGDEHRSAENRVSGKLLPHRILNTVLYKYCNQFALFVIVVVFSWYSLFCTVLSIICPRDNWKSVHNRLLQVQTHIVYF